MEKFENPIRSPETPQESSPEEKPVGSEKEPELEIAEKEEAKKRVDEILAKQEELLKEQMGEQIKFQDGLIQDCKSMEELTNVIQKYGGLVKEEKVWGRMWFPADDLLKRIERARETGSLMKIHDIPAIREKLSELLGLEKEK